MENRPDRVVAIDYLRGVCILAVIVNHATVFSTPIAFLTGEGKLWTSAAAMFFLLSGVTFGIVRSKDVLSNFKKVLKKSFNRAAQLYIIYIIVVLISMLMAVAFSSRGITGTFPGSLPDSIGANFLFYLFTLRFSFGLATYLMYYSIILLAAPLALYALKTKYWPSVLALSGVLYILTAWGPIRANVYEPFLIWQLYFFIGLTLARFRLQILGWYHSLPNKTARRLARGIVVSAGATMLLSVLMTFTMFPLVNKLTASGWLPPVAQKLYIHLLNQRPFFDHWLQDNRSGLARPIVSLLVFAAAYVLYQRNKNFLLEKTGKFINAMGSKTLPVFVAQALVIPLFLALPLPYGSVVVNLSATVVLVSFMWAVSQYQVMYSSSRALFMVASNSMTRYIYVVRTYLVDESE